MAASDVVSIQWDQGNNHVTKAVTKTSGMQVEITDTVAGTTTDKAIHVALDYDAADLILISSDQDLTICTNDTSGGTPTQTLTIKANIPFLWMKNSGITNPISADISVLYVTNAGSTAASLMIKFDSDPTA